MLDHPLLRARVAQSLLTYQIAYLDTFNQPYRLT